MKRPHGFDRDDTPEPSRPRSWLRAPRRDASDRRAVDVSGDAEGLGNADGLGDSGDSGDTDDTGDSGDSAGSRDSVDARGSRASQSTSVVETAEARDSGGESQEIARAVRNPVEFFRTRNDDPVKIATRRVRAAERARKRKERREKRRFSQHARARRLRVLIALGSVTGLALFVVVGAFTPLMDVRETRVVGTSRIAVDDLTAALQPLRGAPLALVSDQEVHQALQKFPLIQQYDVQKVPPHTLIVTIREREPVIAVERGDQLLLVDPAGIVISTVSKDEPPQGVPTGAGFGGDFGSAQFRSAAMVINEIVVETRARIVSVSAPTPQSVTLTLNNGVQVVWGDSTDTPRKTLVLESMIAALADAQVTEIDVSSPHAPVFH